jgi:hypothetical protein
MGKVRVVLEARVGVPPYIHKRVRSALKVSELVFALAQKSEQRVRKLMKMRDILFEESYGLGPSERLHGQREQMCL